MVAKAKKLVEPTAPLKIDLGCGPHKREGFIGVDIRQFEGKVDLVCDLGSNAEWVFTANIDEYAKRGLPDYAEWCDETEQLGWILRDGSVAEAHSSHFVEHLNASQRVNFINELYRVLVQGGKCTLIAPHWASCRSYGDLTHQWPPVSEFWFYYLSKAWRAANAPHNDGYKCDFAATWGYNMRPDLAVRNQEFQQFAFANYKEAIQDLVVTLVKI